MKKNYFFKLNIILNRHDKRQIWGIFFLMLIGAGFEVIGIGAIVPFIGLVSDPSIIYSNEYLNAFYELVDAESPRDFILYTGGALILLYLAKNTFLAFLVYVQSSFLFNKQASLSCELFSAYMARDYAFHLKNNSATLLRNVTVEVSSVMNGVLLPILIVMTEAMVLVAVVTLLMVVQPFVTSVVILFLGSVSFLTYYFISPVLKKHGKMRVDYVGEMNQLVQEGLGGIKESKVLGRVNYFVAGFHRVTHAFAKSARVFYILNLMPRLIMETAAIVMVLLTILLLLMQGLNNADTFSVIALFAMASVRILPSANRIVASLNGLRYYAAAIDVLCGELSKVKRFDGELQSDVEITLQDICFKHVSFKYDGENSSVLNDITLEIKQGDFVAFVGSSGAGKSTLVDLILALQKPSEGKIFIGDKDLNGVEKSWRKLIGYVPQSIYLIDATIRENVAFGICHGSIDDEQVWSVLRMARLDQKVKSLEQGLDTIVGEFGVCLSGGERQRIGIARALYHNPSLLVFDEATSALDSKTEKEISETISCLLGKLTVIMIAHRLSTIQNCHTIYFMKDGKIINSGSYSHLLSTCEEFYQMTSIQ